MTRQLISAALFAALLVGGLTACGPAEPAAVAVADAPSVAGAWADIREVGETDDRLVIDIRPDVYIGDNVFSLGNATKEVGRALQAGAADGGQAATIVMTVSLRLIDRLGQAFDQTTLSVSFKRADLLAANFDNLSVGRTLNLASDITFTANGAQAVAAYCTSERGANQSQPFCTLAASKLPA